tara:strand:- start:36 stop:1010 length:975 start_codon:yes stop_codon:yes gene_type:complete
MKLSNTQNPLSNKNRCIEVIVKRGEIPESIHRVHAVISDSKGRILMKAGNAAYETFIRSALKPFQALTFISSGTAEKINTGDKGIAISCGSHSGTPVHSREAFKILWNSEVEVEQLRCPVPQGRKSRLEHNCSGKHAAFLATCKKMGWPLDTYLENSHPLQIEIIRRVSELLSIASDDLITEKDDCGAPTIRMQLSQMSFLYAQLTHSKNAELEQIIRAMISQPQLIGGEGKFDTELMQRAHGQIVSKGGAEGIQCLSRTGEGLGIAIKAEDGSKRAKHAVALSILRQLDWLTPSGLEELEDQVLNVASNIKLVVNGQMKFQES